MLDMKEFNFENITQRSDLENENSISCFQGHGAQQNPHAFPVFHNFLGEVKPKRILEIGTGMGGFTMFLRLTVLDLELDTDIRSYEINGHQGHRILTENGIDIRLENIFDAETNTINQDVIDYIQGDGTTVILCDGGNKIYEFNVLSNYLKPHDIIMAHDYSPDNNYFMENVNRKLWNWLEIQDKDIAEAVSINNLEPYMDNEFRTAVWVCKIKK